MHHYSFHIKDYAAATAFLSNEEDLAYRRLLDLYYDTEQPIPDDKRSLSKRLRIASEIIESVLHEYFIEVHGVWHHARCDEEIAIYKAKSAKAKIAGSLGGRAIRGKKTKRSADAKRTLIERQANQEPITSNQEQIEADPRFAQFWSIYPKKKAKGDAEKAWKKAKINGEFEQVLEAVRRQSQSEDWIKDGGQFIPFPATWINKKRWLDDSGGVVKSIFSGAI